MLIHTLGASLPSLTDTRHPCFVGRFQGHRILGIEIPYFYSHSRYFYDQLIEGMQRYQTFCEDIINAHGEATKHLTQAKKPIEIYWLTPYKLKGKAVGGGGVFGNGTISVPFNAIPKKKADLFLSGYVKPKSDPFT